MKMKMKNALAICLATALTHLPTTKLARAKMNGNIGYIQSEQFKKSNIQLNAFYKLPLDINSYTFMNLNQDKKGYFGKTSLDKKITKCINPRIQIVHANDIYSQIGLGLSTKIPIPKDITAKINLMPLWYSDREFIDNKMVLGYLLRLNLPMGFSLKSFGEWNLNSKHGYEWEYGEVELAKKLGGVTIGYNPALIKKQGNSVPKIEHRACIRFDF